MHTRSSSIPLLHVSLRCAIVLCLALPLASVCHAADKAERADAPVLVAGLGAPPIAAVPSIVLTQPEMKRASAGVSESLPDLQPTDLPGAPLSFYLFRLGAKMQTEEPAPNSDAGSEKDLQEPAYDETNGISMLNSSPLAPAARRIRAERFNTNDGVNSDAFAICYRLSSRSSFEVIPGDPAPVKIPVASMANNMGVTVGMVLKLGRQHQ